MAYTSVAADAARIRADLKKLGITSRQVSVRSNSYSMGSSIDVEIKDPAVNLKQVEEIAKGAEHVHWDEYANEILSGGNRFVHVKYAYELDKAARSYYGEWCQALLGSGMMVEPVPGLKIIAAEGADNFYLESPKENEVGIYLWQGGLPLAILTAAAQAGVKPRLVPIKRYEPKPQAPKSVALVLVAAA